VANWQRALRLSLMRKVVNRLSRKSYFMAQSYCSHKNVGLCEGLVEYGVRGKFRMENGTADPSTRFTLTSSSLCLLTKYLD